MGKMRETPTDGTGEGLMADEPVDIGESARSTESANRCMTTLAGDFAVKEAVAKALGTGFRGFGPGDIGVLRDGLGKPYVELAGGAKARLEEIGATAVHVSITNTKEYAFAFAVVER
jgi:holo-[acyl-carrier protein] synthase